MIIIIFGLNGLKPCCSNTIIKMLSELLSMFYIVREARQLINKNSEPETSKSCLNRIQVFGNFILILKHLLELSKHWSQHIKNVRNINAWLQWCLLIIQTFYGKMLILKSHLEYSNIQLETLLGQVHLTFGYLTLINLSVGMDLTE